MNIPKLTKKRLSQLRSDHLEYNKFLKSLREKPISFNDYVSYVYGKSKPAVAKSGTFSFKGNTAYEIKGSVQAKHQSHINNSGSCLVSEKRVYTGNLIKGISTLHKSNAVPVISESEMIDHANMRR